jgi:hypothetical protein
MSHFVTDIHSVHFSRATRSARVAVRARSGDVRATVARTE